MPSSTPSATGSATSTKSAAHAVQDPRTSSQSERPKTSSSLVGQKSTPASSRPQTTTARSVPVLNCETIEKKIRKNIQHSWRGILKACTEKDVSKRGEIPVSDFLDIAEKFNLDLSEGEINQITTKYDLKKNGKFAYYDFLQSNILLLKPQESSLLQRVIIQKPQKPVLHEYHINLTEEELFNILEYYDKTLSSKISYNDFLRAFVQ